MNDDSRLNEVQGVASMARGTVAAAAPAGSDPRIEDYLDHVCAPLVGIVSYARRQELRAELRSHLEGLVAGYEEIGSGAEVAVVMALRQFGDPGDLSRRWVREWKQAAVTNAPQPVWPAMWTALRCFSVAGLLALVAPAGMILAAIGRGGPTPDLLSLVLLNALLAAAAGLATGLIAPARQALGSFFGQAALFLPVAAASSAVLTRSLFDGFVADLCGWTCVQTLLWLPVGTATAALGSKLRTRRATQPPRWVLQ